MSLKKSNSCRALKLVGDGRYGNAVPALSSDGCGRHA